MFCEPELRDIPPMRDGNLEVVDGFIDEGHNKRVPDEHVNSSTAER
jgi:hypothetical protein